VAEGDTGTLFLRFRYAGLPAPTVFAIGMTDLSYDITIDEPSPLDMHAAIFDYK